MAVILPDYAEQVVARMSNVERKMMIARLRELIADELAGAATAERCPFCGCPERVRKGHGRDGSQRWLCKGCARTYSGRSMGLLSRSKLEPSAWMTFAECMADVLTLRETASRCGVSLYTAWFMRMRVCEALGLRCRGKCRQGTYHVDGTYVVKSLKGNHGKAAWFRMPRKPHRNGQDGRRGNRAKSGERCCVVCGVNELGDEFCVAASDGAPSRTECQVAVECSVPEGSTVVTDGHKNYGFAGGRYSHVVVDPKDPSTGHINMVNSLHSRLKAFLDRFRGVSTRRLGRYLAWFTYADQVRGCEADRRELLYGAEVDGRYMRSRALTHLELRGIDVYYEMYVIPSHFPGLFMSTVV